ncbi:MAG: P-II family nitrogen regulator [Campylobacterales bacterium]
MKFVALAIITSSEHEDKMKKIAKEAGATGATIIQARGSGYEEKKSFFSLTFEGNHTILLYLLEKKMSKSVLKAIKKDVDGDKSSVVAFTMPINDIVGLDQNLLNSFEENIKTEEL